MAFYKRVNLVGPQQEKLQGWLSEAYAGIGQLVRIKEDDFGRDWTVSESADQLILEAQVDPRHALTAIESPLTQADHAPAAIKAPRAPRKSKLQAVETHN